MKKIRRVIQYTLVEILNDLECELKSHCNTIPLLVDHAFKTRVYYAHWQNTDLNTRVGTLIVVTIYLQLIQNRYMFRSFTLLHCSHQHCVQPVASDVEVVRYL